jgi:hypothetical protein
MSEVAHFVLDTNVISSLIPVDWLHGVERWVPEREVHAPRRVWEEIQSHWDLDEPEWLDVQQVDLDGVRDDYPGSIGPADWSCIVFAESTPDACVVTNDIGMHTVADRRETPWMWGTAFVLSSFKRCGITKPELSAGTEEYADDLGLDEEIVAEIRGAEK